MPLEVRRMQIDTTTNPKSLRLLISDGDTANDSEVWISARVPLGVRGDKSIPVVMMEALDELVGLINQARENSFPGS